MLPIAVAALVHFGDDLDGHDGIGLLVAGAVHRPEGPLAEEGQYLQRSRPIGGRMGAARGRG